MRNPRVIVTSALWWMWVKYKLPRTDMIRAFVMALRPLCQRKDRRSSGTARNISTGSCGRPRLRLARRAQTHESTSRIGLTKLAQSIAVFAYLAAGARRSSGKRQRAQGEVELL